MFCLFLKTGFHFVVQVGIKLTASSNMGTCLHAWLLGGLSKTSLLVLCHVLCKDHALSF